MRNTIAASSICRRCWLPLLIGATALGVASPVAAQSWGSKPGEIDQLAPLLELKPGSTVAEIGAGNGAVAVAAAERVGPAGHVYATEIDPKQLAQIRDRVVRSGLGNVTVLEATADNTELLPRCCDAIYMIGVYHHLTEPMKTDAGILSALRPGGRLVIVDFRPSLLLKPWTPKGIPANRGGHGIPEGILEDELQRSGFQIIKVFDRWGNSWFLSNYCVVSINPAAPEPSSARH